jgi:hypothetical protein
MDDDSAPSMVTVRPEIIQLERPTAEGFEYFSLNSAHAAKPTTPEQTPGYSGYILVAKINPIPSNSAEDPRSKSRKKNTASNVVLSRTSHKESLRRPNISGLSGAKPIRKMLYAQTKAVAQKKQKSPGAEETCCLVCVESQDEGWIQCERCKHLSHEDCAE